MGVFLVFSTTENVAVFIWESIAPMLKTAQLHEVKVHETEKNIVVFRGEYSWFTRVGISYHNQTGLSYERS